MYTRILSLAVAAGALLAPAAVYAQEREAFPLSGGWYLSGAVGGSWIADADFTDSGLSGEISLDGAPVLAGAVGKSLTDTLRAEVEVSWRRADLDALTLDGFTGSAGLSGDLSTTAALASLAYDFNPGGRLRPYVTGGVGLAHHDGDLDAVGGLPARISDSDTTFAWQVGAGAAWALSDRVALFGGYRYLGSADPSFDTLEAEFGAHEVQAGLRWAL
jgi:OmpA-OmpF porin, OOP family